MIALSISSSDMYVDSFGGDEDYKNRKKQWDKVMAYVDTIKDKESICVVGDFNNGVIGEKYTSSQFRRFYNYQMIVSR